MSELFEKQVKFCRAIGKLIAFAESKNMLITFGDAYRDPRAFGALGVQKSYSAANSCHKLRLAVDFNLIIDGKLAPAEAYNELHDFWDTLGGSKRIANDMNHFSFEHNGCR
jgi:hypothetical protein